MGDLLATGASWLAGQLKAHAATPAVVYSRPGVGSVTLTASRGSTRTEVADEDGTVLVAAVLDWLIDADDLVIAGALAEPRPGDTLTVVEAVSGGGGQRTTVYEVVQIAGSEAWRRRDPGGRMLRIHTQIVSEERTT